MITKQLINRFTREQVWSYKIFQSQTLEFINNHIWCRCRDRPVRRRDKPAPVHRCRPPWPPTGGARQQRAALKTYQMLMISSGFTGVLFTSHPQNGSFLKRADFVPVRATRRGRHRRLARTMSSMGSRPGQAVSRPEYRNSNTPRMQAVLVLGMGTLETTEIKWIAKRKDESPWEHQKRSYVSFLFPVNINESGTGGIWNLRAVYKLLWSQTLLLAQTKVWLIRHKLVAWLEMNT